MNSKDFPSVHFYDQDFVYLYEKSWAWMQDFWQQGDDQNKFPTEFFNHPGSDVVNQMESCMSTFFLVYSNGVYPVSNVLDLFYSKQEENGAIRGNYRVKDGRPVLDPKNPEGIQAPMFSLAEYNLYHKVGNKKRLKDIIPFLEKYFDWIVTTFRKENGLYVVPLSAAGMENSPRDNAKYLIDFNCQQAINALYMSAIGDILNDKEMAFKYKRHFFSLKTRINAKMWNEEDQFFYDLDENENFVKVRTLASYWTLLGEIPNEDHAEKMISYLSDPKFFGSDHPFPTVAVCEKSFCEDGNGFNGSVFPAYTFIVIKGLEKYKKYEFARECSIRHMYFILDTLHLEAANGGDVFEAYLPLREGASSWAGKEGFPRKRAMAHIGMSTITLMIENILGLYISLPKKTVEWIIPTMEILGIENLSLKRNLITILSNKSGRGWEIRLESDKLYYFTIHILDVKKKKTLPIPSGKCSMLIDKL